MIWQTPIPVFRKINEEFRFTIDLCADRENAKCECYLDRGVSLYDPWDFEGWAWLNPPYGKDIWQWLFKASRIRHIVALVPSATNAPWWHEYVLRANEIRCIRKKLAFIKPDGTKKGVPMTGHVLAIFDGAANGAPVMKSWDWR